MLMTTEKGRLHCRVKLKEEDSMAVALRLNVGTNDTVPGEGVRSSEPENIRNRPESGRGAGAVSRGQGRAENKRRESAATFYMVLV